MFPMQGMKVGPLIRELRSHIPHGVAKNKLKKKKSKKEKDNVHTLRIQKTNPSYNSNVKKKNH